MIQWIGTVIAALLTLGALCSPSIAWAKPADLPGAVQQQCPEGRDGQQAEGFRTRPSDLAPLISAPTPNDLQARHLFEIAERCRAAGDHAKARTCYEEAHLLSPTSPHGRLAIDRLWELDRARLRNNADAAEEQEAPPVRELQREPTERRREVNLEPTPRRLRETVRPVDDDARHKEILRSTQLLETLPEQSRDDDGALQEAEVQPIQYYEVPAVRYTGPPTEKPRRMPMADEEIRDEVQPTSPASWTPGFDFTGGRWGFGFGANAEAERLEVERMRFPWDGWRARLVQGLVWYDWPRVCIVRQFRPETRIRGFADHEGSATGLVPPAFIGAENSIGMQKAIIPTGTIVGPQAQALEFFEDRFVVTSMGLVAPIGPTPSAGYLPPTWIFSKQPMLLIVYPFEERVSDELKPVTPPGTQGDFELPTGFIF